MPAVVPDAAVVAAAGVLAVVAEAAEELEVLPPPPQPAIARATMPVTPRTPTFDLFMESSDSVVEVQPRGRLRETILPVVRPACRSSHDDQYRQVKNSGDGVAVNVERSRSH